MKKNKFNKEKQNLFAVGGFMTPYGVAGFTPYGVPMGTPSASQITMYYDGLNAKKEIASRKNNKQSNINAGVSSKLFADGGTLFDYDIAPADNTRVNTSVVLPVERQSDFRDSNYFWDSGSEFPAGFWRQKDGSFKTTNIANGEPITFTQEEVDSIVRANTAKGRKERLKKAMESKFVYEGLMNDSPTLLNAMPKNVKAIGGVVQTNSSDFSTGLTHINNGGSHEESPYDGVQIGVDSEGVPNLVEEGEVIFNDYVFSKRINLDEDAKKKFHFPKKSELSYADAAKKLEKEVKERPNDPISRASFKSQMEQLEEHQERQKQEMEAERAKEAFEALSPEEQTALMQQKAQQDAMEEQAAQEQAIAEAQAAQGQPSPEEMAAMEQQAAMAQQQMSPEEVAMMQQQMAAQQGGMPVEGVAPEGYAYGGELSEGENIFADGGALKWLKEKYPNLKHKEVLAELMEKIKDTKTSTINYSRRGKDGSTEYDYASIYEDIGPSKVADKKRYDLLISMGVNPQVAFDFSYPEVPVSGKAGIRWKSDRDTAYKTWVGEARTYAKPNNSPDPRSFYAVVNQQSSSSTPKSNPQVSSPSEQDGTMQRSSSNTEVPVSMQPASKKVSSVPTKAAVNQYLADLVSGDINWDDFANRYKAYTASKAAGKVAGHYAPDASFDFGKYNAQDIQDLQDSADYQNFTKYVREHPDDPQVQAYLHALDDGTHEDVEKLFGKDGKLKSNWQDLYNHRRTDGIAGIYHLNPFMVNDDGEVVADTPEAIAAANSAVATDNAALEAAAQQETATRAANGEPEAAWNAGDPVVEKNTNEGKNPDGTKPEAYGTSGTQAVPVKVVPNLKEESYWGLFGPAVGLGMQMAGIGKPDTSGIDAAIASANSAPHLAEYKPLGNYLTYRPMDVWFEQNALNAQSRATDRSIMNAGANQGGAMAGLIANGYNSQLASGELFRKGLEYNTQDEIAKATFNRGTDQYNADAFTKNSQFNADVLNRGKQYAASLGLQGAAQKMDADAGWYNGIYGNVSGIFDRLNQWEKWKRDHNTIAKMAADGLFDNMSDRQYTGQGFLKTVSAEGGKVRKKKSRKKKGFTF